MVNLAVGSALVVDEGVADDFLDPARNFEVRLGFWEIVSGGLTEANEEHPLPFLCSASSWWNPEWYSWLSGSLFLRSGLKLVVWME
jgi:hypothetical protein